MYKGNPLLRSRGEKIDYTPEMLNEYIKCKEDIIYFAENYFYIVNIDLGKIKIPLYKYQKKMLKAMKTPQRYRGELKRHCIVLSSRQVGKSVVSRIFLLHSILFNKDKTYAILANKEKTALKLLKELKDAYAMLPLWLQQGVVDGGWNKQSIEFENGIRVISSSTSSSAIRSESIALVFLDEFAFVPDNIANEFMSSVYPTISSGKTSRIIIVSTPKGLNAFHDIWKDAIDGNNNYYPIKVNWWEVPGRDKKFKEQTIKDLPGGLVQWSQEYACQFLGSSSTLIESDILETTETIDPIALKWSGALQIFEEPIAGGSYVLGIDTAKGVGNDSSVIQVLKVVNDRKIIQVATYRNNLISPYDYGSVCLAIGQYYNNAYMMVESNAEGGEVLNVLWYDFEYENICNCDKKGLGIRSTRTSKLNANMLLKEYMDKGWLKINNKHTIYELSRYVEVRPNIFKSETETAHDDEVTSLLWGLWFIRTPFYDGKITDRTFDNRFKLEDNTDNEAPFMYIDDGINSNFDYDDIF